VRSTSRIEVSSRTLTLVLWINRLLEVLWLLTVVLVPLAFLDRDYILSEAVVAFAEVPKIALLRTTVAFMGVLWVLEWGLVGRLPFAFGMPDFSTALLPRVLVSRLLGWFLHRPTRWLLLAVWFFFATTLLSTVFSGAFSVSLWGEVPGQDGFQAYNIAAYLLLFGVLATHLRTQNQLWRVLGAIVVMGTLAGGYGILQNYNRDFFDLMVLTGGNFQRSTMMTGNAVFAGALMLLPVMVTLLTATLTLREPMRTTGSLRRDIQSWITALLIVVFWVLILNVQLLGLVFTFSRGPWVGTLLATIMFLGLAGVFIGWRALGRAALVLGLSGVMTLIIVRWQGILSLLGGDVVLGPLVGVGMLLGVVALLKGWSERRRVSMGFGKVLPMAGLGLSVLALLATLGIFTTVGLGAALGDSPTTGGAGSSAGDVGERFASIGVDVVSGSISNRGIIWQGSWELIGSRPWFEFADLSLTWLRPVVGYGPDLFRYTYLLVSATEGSKLLPLEPDHAHNYLIHQWVEQGILGAFSSLGIFFTVFVVGGYELWRYRSSYSSAHKLVLAGLLAIFAGRFLEQIVGVARVSDLTVLWVLLAVFAALPVMMAAPEPVEQLPASGQRPRGTRARGRSRRRQRQPYDWQMLARLMVVAWVCGGVIALTWVKTINYARAAVVAAESVEQFSRADFAATLESLNRAVALAPDVATYYNFRAVVYDAYYNYRANDLVPREQECGFRTDGVSYESCLVQKSYQSNLAGARQRPFYWRARLALADSAFFLSLDEDAIRLYEETVSLVPDSWPLYNRLAGVYIETGHLDEAMRALDTSLSITRGTENSSQALELQATVRQKLNGSADSPSVP